jgi:hypothetical protein
MICFPSGPGIVSPATSQWCQWDWCTRAATAHGSTGPGTAASAPTPAAVPPTRSARPWWPSIAPPAGVFTGQSWWSSPVSVTTTAPTPLQDPMQRHPTQAPHALTGALPCGARLDVQVNPLGPMPPWEPGASTMALHLLSYPSPCTDMLILRHVQTGPASNTFAVFQCPYKWYTSMIIWTEPLSIMAWSSRCSPLHRIDRGSEKIFQVISCDWVGGRKPWYEWTSSVCTKTSHSIPLLSHLRRWPHGEKNRSGNPS